MRRHILPAVLLPFALLACSHGATIRKTDALTEKPPKTILVAKPVSSVAPNLAAVWVQQALLVELLKRGYQPSAAPSSLEDRRGLKDLLRSIPMTSGSCGDDRSGRRGGNNLKEGDGARPDTDATLESQIVRYDTGSHLKDGQATVELVLRLLDGKGKEIWLATASAAMDLDEAKTDLDLKGLLASVLSLIDEDKTPQPMNLAPVAYEAVKKAVADLPEGPLAH